MTKNQIKVYIDCGREIEFKYDGKMYSITYGKINGQHVISFCEFYKETTEATSAEEILAIERNGKSVLDMLEGLPDDAIRIY
jgi:hypothetical protein